jgi:hypothetical protein
MGIGFRVEDDFVIIGKVVLQVVDLKTSLIHLY